MKTFSFNPRDLFFVLFLFCLTDSPRMPQAFGRLEFLVFSLTSKHDTTNEEGMKSQLKLTYRPTTARALS